MTATYENGATPPTCGYCRRKEGREAEPSGLYFQLNSFAPRSGTDTTNGYGVGNSAYRTGVNTSAAGPYIHEATVCLNCCGDSSAQAHQFRISGLLRERNAVMFLNSWKFTPSESNGDLELVVRVVNAVWFPTGGETIRARFADEKKVIGADMLMAALKRLKLDRTPFPPAAARNLLAGIRLYREQEDHWYEEITRSDTQVQHSTIDYEAVVMLRAWLSKAGNTSWENWMQLGLLTVEDVFEQPGAITEARYDALKTLPEHVVQGYLKLRGHEGVPAEWAMGLLVPQPVRGE